MSYLLDANPAISFLKGRPEAVTLIGQLLGQGLAFSIIAWGEIYEGLLSGSESPRRIAQFEAFSANLPLLAPDVDVARQYGTLRSDLRAQGQLLADNDLWIASTALAHDLTLVSSDRHFRRVPGLKLLQPT